MESYVVEMNGKVFQENYKEREEKQKQVRIYSCNPAGGKRNFRSRPTIPVMDLFPSGEFPEGEIQQYKDDNLWRITSEEKRALERLAKPMYNSVRQAAEVHRQVRKYMKSTLKLGMLMTDPCDCISYWMLSELGCCSLDPKYRGREEIREAGEL